MGEALAMRDPSLVVRAGIRRPEQEFSCRHGKEEPERRSQERETGNALYLLGLVVRLYINLVDHVNTCLSFLFYF
jgi:hypothetical protein